MCRSAATGLNPTIVEKDLSIEDPTWVCVKLETVVDMAKIGYYITRAFRMIG